MRHIYRQLKGIVLVLMLAGLASTGMTVLPRGWDAAHILMSKDPSRIADHRLRTVPADKYAEHIEQALVEEDIELATSLMELAQEQAINLPSTLLQRVQEANSWTAATSRTAQDVWQGISTGQADSASGLAAALVSDFMLIGDIRDVTRESLAWPEHDPVVLALAGTGLGLTAVTVASAGGATPLKAGVSLLKVARKTGRMSQALGMQFLSLTRHAIDSKALARVGAKLERVELTKLSQAQLNDLALASKQIIHAKTARTLADSGQSVRHLIGNSSVRGALDALGKADSLQELSRLEKLSGRFGTRFRGVLRLLPDAGKGLYRLLSVMYSVISWLALAAMWVATALWTIISLLKALLRPA